MLHGMPKVSIFLLVACGFAQEAKTTLKIVPERYLRDHDPITAFFPTTVGPEQGGPGDDPGELMRLDPAVPGEFRWLDGRTLQFQPALAWPPLSKIQVSCSGHKKVLWTLMSSPRFIGIQPGNFELERFETLTLGFSAQIPVENILRLLRFEVRPLPGQGEARAFLVKDDGLEISALEPERAGLETQYLVKLKHAVPEGNAIKMILELSLDPNLKERFASYEFGTKPLFRLSGVKLGDKSFPISAKGSVFAKDQAVSLTWEQPRVSLEFSHYLGQIQLSDLKKMVRIEPEIRNFRHEVQGKRISLYFDCDSDRSYRLSLAYSGIRDQSQRLLAPFSEAVLWFYQTKRDPSLDWVQPEGLLERFGAQELPMKGSGVEKVDLRIYKIDPLDRRFWPMAALTEVDEAVAPPLSGIKLEPYDRENQIRTLGSPIFSRIVALPLRESGPQLHFGLDLKGPLTEIAGINQPGHYLVGYRELGATTKRTYARIQVSDLSVSWVQLGVDCIFFVRSLKTAAPIAGASLMLEGLYQDNLTTMISGQTDNMGVFFYKHDSEKPGTPFRIRVRYGEDLLVIQPKSELRAFRQGEWSDYSYFFHEFYRGPNRTSETVEQVAFLFSERPVYRPEEEVQIRGFLRERLAGQLRMTSDKVILQIIGPGGRKWSYPVQLDENGSFFSKFLEPDLPSGDYQVSLVIQNGAQWGWPAETRFKKEAYRLPRFEVRMTGPDFVGSDRPFEVGMFAQYYSGGRVVDQPLHWRVSRRSYTPDYSAYPDFSFSTDERFSTTGGSVEGYESGFEARTDENGSSSIVLDPSSLRDASPHQVLIEAEVTGADQQSVANSKRVVVSAPFALGIKSDRVLKNARSIKAEVVILGADGKPLPQLDYRVRLSHRQWHSYVKESDFTTGKAQYVTEVQDQPLETRDQASTGAPQTFEFQIGEPGVFLLEVSAKDLLGRMLKVVVDVFVSGEGAVAWKKPKDLTFDARFEKSAYAPGETANLILESPFQSAEALALVEGPEGPNLFHQTVRNGQAIIAIPVKNIWTLSVPISLVLERGRLESKSGKDELLKPRCLAGSVTLNVKPLAFQAELKLKHAASSLPGRTFPIQIELKDPDGKPLDGVVTLWLVDRAVLALGRERSLDPLSQFTKKHESIAEWFSSRNLILGEIPLEELPGGDGSDQGESLFGQVTVRRNFKTVPYYQPAIQVRNGLAQVDVPLPDDLTEFAIRAVAASGVERFGFAKSSVAVRLPVQVQTALPRFVRPGDRFSAGGVGRIVEGDAGAVQAELRVEGLNCEASLKRALDWPLKQAVPLFFPLEVAREAALPNEPGRDVVISMAVRRTSDGMSDGFEVRLPIRPDLFPVSEQAFSILSPGATLTLKPLARKARVEGFQRDLVVSSKPELLDLIAALDFNFGYPFGCTEQKISSIFPALSLRKLLGRIGQGERVNLARQMVKELQMELMQRQTEEGLFVLWPGSKGNLALTAYVVDFLALARELDLLERPELLEKALNALEASLRSDSRINAASNTREGSYNRAYALYALARAGRFDPGYALDMAARALEMPVVDEARIYQALAGHRLVEPKLLARLEADLWDSVQFEQRDGKDLVSGLNDGESDGFQGYHRTLGGSFAEVTRALSRAAPEDPRLKLITNELLRRGRSLGWQDTQDNAAMLIALSEVFDEQTQGADKGMVFVAHDSGNRELDLGKQPAYWEKLRKSGAIQLTSRGVERPVGVWTQFKYLPDEKGAETPAVQAGFVLERTLQIYEGGDAKQAARLVKVEDHGEIQLSLGDLVEEQVRVINPENRRFVAVRIPFAAGFEPLNPNLETAPAEAKPAGKNTLEPTYARFEDDQVTFFFDNLPKGTFSFYFRERANTEGVFTQPAARVELMYQPNVFGDCPGNRLLIQGK